ncbi:MAG: hypothetical protein KGZ92_01975 [Firmicutes bacterium]|nr:hypothetical protein [Dethiobacter sp.]MBS3888052.1 hypothetical protein [Bacillota bacterium]MBS4055210.1 hypothetical protein [Thermaerobacter sp.]
MPLYVLAINVANRSASASAVQHILTQYGCHIRTRVGFHHTSQDSCTEDGLIILQMDGGVAVCDELLAELNSLEKVQAKYIRFE